MTAIEQESFSRVNFERLLSLDSLPQLAFCLTGSFDCGRCLFGGRMVVVNNLHDVLTWRLCNIRQSEIVENFDVSGSPNRCLIPCMDIT